MRFTTLPMTLRQLQYVCAVADELSFRKAAERCHVSQPSLSAQIAELEQALDLRLFERGRRGVMLTRAGAEVITRARAVLLAADDVVDAAERLTDPCAGPLDLGVIPTIGPYLLPDLDPGLRLAFPKLQLRWTEGKTETLVAQIRAGELDGALLALDVDLMDLESEAVGDDQFVLAAPREHPLGRRKGPVSMDDLQEQRVLLLDDGHCFRDQALDLCSMAGASEHGFRATSLSTLVQMAASGDAVTILPRLSTEVENRRARLVVRNFRKPCPHRRLGFAWRPGSAVTPTMKQVADQARRIYRTLSRCAPPGSRGP